MPPYLIRTLGNKKYYEEFLNGKFLMRHLRYYREMEDSVRKDNLEGKAKIISQGHVCHLGEAGDMTFILCTSSPEVRISDTEKFGDTDGTFRAKICNPTGFISLLNAHLGALYPKQYVGDARILEVRYIKDEGTYPDHTKSTLQEDIDAIVSHKPVRFAAEKEYRIVCSFVTGAMDKVDKLPIELGEIKGVIESFA